MSKTIVMHDTACGPEGNFYAGQRYEVGSHISKEEAEQFVSRKHASYVDVKAEAKPAQVIESAEAEGGPENAAARTGKPDSKGKK